MCELQKHIYTIYKFIMFVKQLQKKDCDFDLFSKDPERGGGTLSNFHKDDQLSGRSFGYFM